MQPAQETQARRPLIGAHVPVAGGLATAGLAYAAAVGAEVIQVFAANPRSWATAPGNPAQDEALRRHSAETGLPVFVHAPYLINLGSPDELTASRSVSALAHALRRGEEIGARGVVVHTGSAVGGERDAALRRVASGLLPLLDKLGDDGPDVLLEPMAGQGQMLCADVSELEAYLDILGRHPKACVCVDTCHVFAAGHDLTAPGGPAAMLDALMRAAGPGRVKLVHANDSAASCGSRRDRHANIGAGKIGTAPMRELLQHPALADVPFVVETPGDKKAHARDIATLKQLFHDRERYSETG
ncbi:MAG TPA: deoxyribonuclease IV [Streptosporangiaceae bacterium]|nr:deoxyribonuclease IV [Streptosporangiaceae bacterium]